MAEAILDFVKLETNKLYTYKEYTRRYGQEIAHLCYCQIISTIPQS